MIPPPPRSTLFPYTTLFRSHLTSATNPTGTITFNLYGPDDATCGGAVIFSSTVPVSGNGDYTSARDRKSVAEGKSVDLGGRRISKKKKNNNGGNEPKGTRSVK